MDLYQMDMFYNELSNFLNNCFEVSESLLTAKTRLRRNEEQFKNW